MGPQEHPIMTGVIVSVVRKSPKTPGGYFFIRDEDGHERFAHHRSLIGIKFRSLEVDMRVEFRPVTVEQGLRAEDIQVLA
jgi:cold shock CspA family protein